ncbi:MAG: 3-phosphoshikimate 1-carboxyvinyltransferase [Bacteroidota bacterium]
MEITLGPAKSIVGTFDVPGDKSISHRALLVASIADGVSSLHNLLQAQDPESTIRCLRSLGVKITRNGETTEVYGQGLNGFRRPTADLDAGNSGTTMRLLSGILAGQPFESTITGDESLRNRPMQRVVDPLTRMGAVISSQKGKPPLTIQGKNPLDAISHTLQVPSAQVKSAILLAGLFAEGATTITEKVITRDHTERLLNLPVRTNEEGRTITVVGGTRIPPFTIVVPGDISSAVFLICAAALVPGSDIVIRNVGLNPTRTAVLGILTNAGLQLSVERTSHQEPEEYGDIRVKFGPASRPIDLDSAVVPQIIDEIPALAVLAAASGVECSVRGAGELRVKESDRVSLLVRNLRSIGVPAEEAGDGFSFERAVITSGRVQSGGDHRIAMAFALAGLRGGAEITIDEAEASEISFPHYWGVLESFQKR